MTEDATEPLLESFLRRLTAAPRCVLFLDYDGTLAPFVVMRQQAKPYPGVVPLLETILSDPGTRLVVVSGRPAEEVRGLLGLDPPPEIWGSHGMERRFPDGRRELVQLEASAHEALEDAARWASGLGLGERVERKHGAVAVHWRGLGAERVERLAREIRRHWEPLAWQGDLKLTEFDGGLELRAPGRDKGDAVRQVLGEEPPGTPAAYLGDDRTDEDAFQAIGAQGIGILVRGERRPSAARVWLRPPEDLLDFLRSWIQARQARGGPQDSGNPRGGSQ
jgi:trehalose-phosphatase